MFPSISQFDYDMLTFDVAIGGILSQLGVVSFLSEADECLVLTRDAIEVVPLVMF